MMMMIIINITIMWDMPVNTDRIITANRPDINVKDSVNSTCKLIDITVTSDRNIALKEIEKKSNYKDLELEIRRMWHIKTVGSKQQQFRWLWEPLVPSRTTWKTTPTKSLATSTYMNFRK